MDDEVVRRDTPAAVWRVEVPTADAEVAADRLWAAGAGAVVVEEQGARVVLVADVAPSGHVPPTWAVEVADADAAPPRRWLDGLPPVTIGPWTVHRPGTSIAGPGAVAIEPGDAFGSGHHPTTRLALGALARVVVPGCRVLDVGCGSGILAVAAALVGARCVAVDVDDAAVAVTRRNAERNGVADRVDVRAGSVPAADGTFDVVVANLLLPGLVEIAPGVRERLADPGAVIVSGLLVDQVAGATQALGLREVGRDGIGDWVGLVYRRDP